MADDSNAEQQTDTSNKQEKGTSFTINKIHVRIGKPFPMHSKQGNWVNCLSSLPTIPEKQANYVPMPYTFRLPPAPKPTHVKNVVAKSPPFHLLLDHTIAVIWMVFSNETYDSPLGIVQLQWALAFLKTIYSKSGERPKDVELCIEVIEDQLIEQYAGMAKQLSQMDKINDSSHYADGAFGSKTVVVQTFPFSKNYADLVEKLGEKQADDVPSITSAAAQEELENLKKAAGVESMEKLDSVSREKAVNVLKIWHHEQTGKIKEEMKKLKSIEEQIQQVNAGNFQYLDAAQMETLFFED
ncbi:uncharacterized protein LOC143205254 [Rhynchophorus ferrugineus]|uniref:Uncharacterized protein n=1 Tax=Rhynchophorus ferrugineus TaxID=354439 RepID=A0A834M4Y0_RHYFE|nr:hypothetical protein GWI33_014999 [Rhynchophorus ferrugineus]